VQRRAEVEYAAAQEKAVVDKAKAQVGREKEGNCGGGGSRDGSAHW
jgi:hypothetical protein